MTRKRKLWGLLLAVCGVMVARAELRLVGEVGGQAIVAERAGAGRLLGRSGREFVSLPMDGTFRIDGDLRENAAQVYWTPHFYLHRPPARDRVAPAQRPWFGYLRVVSGRNWGGFHFEDIWPGDLSGPMMTVFGWMVGGRLVQTKVVPVPAESQRGLFRIDHLFQLSEAEAQGVPVLLLWREGKFLAPRPAFKAPKEHAALVALLTGDQAGFRGLVEGGLNLRAASNSSASFLHLAARLGSSEATDLLLARGVKADPFLGVAGTPLTIAAATGRVAVVRSLLAAKAQVDRKDGEYLPLQLALRGGHEEVAALLVDHGAAWKGGSLIEGSPFNHAIGAGFADVVRRMAARGARDGRDAEARAALLIEQVTLGHTALVAWLLEQKYDPNAVSQGRSPLWIAARTGERDLVAELLRAGAKAECADPSGTTALMLAAAAGDSGLVRQLLAAGASAKVQRADGNTAVHLAALYDSVELLELLREAGADWQAEGAGQMRPVELAVLAGAKRVATHLAEAGARCALDRGHSEIVLATAIEQDVAAVVRGALADGWDPAKPLLQQSTPLDRARLAGAGLTAELLRAAGSPEAAAPVPLVPVANLDRKPEPVSAPALPDPRESFARSVDTVLEVECVIDETGRVVRPRIRGAVPPAWSLVVLPRFRFWRFAPPLRDGRAVRTEIVHRVVFPKVADAVAETAFVDVPPRPITRWIPSVLPWGEKSGDVRFSCVVNVNGGVEDVQIIHAPDRDHARSTFNAVPNWSFTPGVRDGVRLRTQSSMLSPVHF